VPAYFSLGTRGVVIDGWFGVRGRGGAWECHDFRLFPHLLWLSHRRPHVPQSRGHLSSLLFFSFEHFKDLSYLIFPILSYLSYLILSFLSYLIFPILSYLSYLILSFLSYLIFPFLITIARRRQNSCHWRLLLGQRARLATGKPHPIRIGDLGIHHEITTLRRPNRHHPTTQGTIHGALPPLPQVPVHLRLQRLQSLVGRTGDRWCLVRTFRSGLRV